MHIETRTCAIDLLDEHGELVATRDVEMSMIVGDDGRVLYVWNDVPLEYESVSGRPAASARISPGNGACWTIPVSR
jgi:hypothetical protein